MGRFLLIPDRTQLWHEPKDDKRALNLNPKLWAWNMSVFDHGKGVSFGCCRESSQCLSYALFVIVRSFG